MHPAMLLLLQLLRACYAAHIPQCNASSQEPYTAHLCCIKCSVSAKRSAERFTGQQTPAQVPMHLHPSGLIRQELSWFPLSYTPCSSCTCGDSLMAFKP